MRVVDRYQALLFHTYDYDNKILLLLLLLLLLQLLSAILLQEGLRRVDEMVDAFNGWG